MRKIFTVVLFLSFAVAACAEDAHPILALGSPAPNFELPGVDGQMHKLSDYAASPVLVVVFTCNHCPIAQMYEPGSRSWRTITAAGELRWWQSSRTRLKPSASMNSTLPT